MVRYNCISIFSSEPIGEASVRGIFKELCFLKRRKEIKADACDV